MTAIARRQPDARIDRLPAEAVRLPKLDALQVGHLRHISNLAHNLDGDWSHMGGMEAGQENPTSYRYQLAWMAYALGIAHFHRLPGAPGAFKNAYVNLMRKMLRYDVWGYWEHTSKSSSFLDPSLVELRQGWRDPVVKENIMYSGHVHAMAGLFGVLFDDDRYERAGGLTFEFNPLFASGADRFVYDLSSLDDVIYWQMVENGFLGIACEPNMVFLVCNQFPMLGFRFHDIRKGTERAQEVTAAHEAAWRRKGWLKDDNFFAFYFVKQDAIVGAQNSYTAAVMNAWNPQFVHGLYPRQIEDAFEQPEPGMLLPTPRSLLGDRIEHFAGPDSAVGLAALWFSEMGDQPRLDQLLRYADTYLAPTWERGGLCYPRRDDLYDDDGHFVHVDPWVGNALIAYSRLNVADGLHKLYSEPWNKTHFDEPNLAEISRHADVLRAGYLPEIKALVATVQPDASARGRNVEVAFDRVCQGSGHWRLELDGELLASGHGDAVVKGDAAFDQEARLTVSLPTKEETDLVLWVDL
jgi:Linalool dehydratase/isomerase